MISFSYERENPAKIVIDPVPVTVPEKAK